MGQFESIIISEPGFYTGYSDPESNSLTIDADRGIMMHLSIKTTQNDFYFFLKTYKWTQDQGVVLEPQIDAPRLSRTNGEISSISFGDSTQPCTIRSTSINCNVYVNAYNDTDNKMDRYIADLNSITTENSTDDFGQPTIKYILKLNTLDGKRVGFLDLDIDAASALINAYVLDMNKNPIQKI